MAGAMAIALGPGNGFSLAWTHSVEKTEAYTKGRFHVQDLSSQLCCAALDPQEQRLLLDLIRKRSNGVVRTIVSALDKIEKMAMASDARIIRLEDVDASELLHDVRRSR